MLRPEALKYLLALGAVVFVLSNVFGILMEILLKRANQPTGSHLDLGRRDAKTFAESISSPARLVRYCWPQQPCWPTTRLCEGATRLSRARFCFLLL
jgi:hypothetical protein